MRSSTEGGIQVSSRFLWWDNWVQLVHNWVQFYIMSSHTKTPEGNMLQAACIVPSMGRVVPGDVSAAVAAWSGTSEDRDDKMVGWFCQTSALKMFVQQDTYTRSSFLLSLA